MTSKKDNLIIYLVFGIPLLVLIFYGVQSMFYGPTRNERMLKDDANQHFAGRIESFYFDKNNHNGKYAILRNNETCPISRPWERYIEVGDSLSKKKDSFFLIIYKKDHKKLILDYREIYK